MLSLHQHAPRSEGKPLEHPAPILPATAAIAAEYHRRSPAGKRIFPGFSGDAIRPGAGATWRFGCGKGWAARPPDWAAAGAGEGR